MSQFALVLQFDKEASQARDYCGANAAPRSRGSPGSLRHSAQGRLFAAQNRLAQDDKQTAPLRNFPKVTEV
jgi:hypothetical protein